MKKKILIVNTFGIGDVLFSTPMIKTLAKRLPDAEISYICNERAYAVLKNNKILKKIIIFEKDYFRKLFRENKMMFLKKFVQFLKEIKSTRANIMVDLTLNYQASLVGKILGIQKRIGFNYRNRGKFLTDKIEISGFTKKHVAFHYLDLLKTILIETSSPGSIESFTSREDDLWAEACLRKLGLENKFFIGIVPGGGRSWGGEARYRRWPVSNFAHVADQLIDAVGVPVILFGDSDEKNLCSNMQSYMRNKVVNMSGKTSVSQFMSLIKNAELLLCNEGGPLHIAVSLGVPTVSIFGPVDEKIYGPFSNEPEKHTIISERIKCQPCYVKFKHKKCDTILCLESISERKIFDAVKTLMERIKK